MVLDFSFVFAAICLPFAYSVIGIATFRHEWLNYVINGSLLYDYIHEG